MARVAAGVSVAVLISGSAASAAAAPGSLSPPAPGVYYDQGLQVLLDLQPDGDLVLLDDLNTCQKEGWLLASLGTPDSGGFTGTYYGYYDDDPAEPCAKGSSVITFQPTSDGTGLTYRVDGITGTLVAATTKSVTVARPRTEATITPDEESSSSQDKSEYSKFKKTSPLGVTFTTTCKVAAVGLLSEEAAVASATESCWDQIDRQATVRASTIANNLRGFGVKNIRGVLVCEPFNAKLKVIQTKTLFSASGGGSTDCTVLTFFDGLLP